MPDVDIYIVVAYGKIIPKQVLNRPKLGIVNVHPSLLPKYRGPSPVQSAIAHQEKISGVSIMLLDEKMDHGPILAQKEIPIARNETTSSFFRKVIEIGAPLLVESVNNFAAGKLQPKEQNHKFATYCQLLKKEDGKINWRNNAEEIHAKIRAYNPWPGTFTVINEKIFKIHDAKISENKLPPGKIKIENKKLLIGTAGPALEILSIQPAGKQKMQAKDFINGFHYLDGLIIS